MTALTEDHLMITSKCLATESICVSGEEKGLARYPPLQDYILLKTEFEYVFNLIHDSFPYGCPQMFIGEFEITFDEKKIMYRMYDTPSTEIFLPVTTFDILTADKKITNYMNLWVTKIVEDYMVYKKYTSVTKTTFSVTLAMAKKRELSAIGFHVDRDDTMDCNYFTLTYMLPEIEVKKHGTFKYRKVSYNRYLPNKMILSASILSDEPDVEGNFTTASFPVSDLSTIGLTTRGYGEKLSFHSTPIRTTSRLLTNGLPHKSISLFGSCTRNNDRNIESINIIPNSSISTPLQGENEDELLDNIIENTGEERRFLGVFYLDTLTESIGFSKSITFDCQVKNLLDNIIEKIKYITIPEGTDPIHYPEISAYALGRKRLKRRLKRISKRISKRTSKQTSKQTLKRTSKRKKHKETTREI